MPRHAETRHLPYTPEQMYDLVADVESYAKFLPWVVAVRVRSDAPGAMLADLVVGFSALREKFTSQISKTRPTSVHVDYIEGPLKFLHNDWQFRPEEGGGCAIDFSVDFQFKSRIFEALAGQMFERALRKMIGAFETRAAQLYGSGDSGSSKSSATSAA